MGRVSGERVFAEDGLDVEVVQVTHLSINSGHLICEIGGCMSTDRHAHLELVR